MENDSPSTEPVAVRVIDTYPDPSRVSPMWGFRAVIAKMRFSDGSVGLRPALQAEVGLPKYEPEQWDLG
jgi:hypothetical protein